LAQRRILEVSRSGKRVLFEFSGELWLAVHLRMTGRLQWTAEAKEKSLPHLRARLFLDRGALLFIDTRRFGTFDWYRSLEEVQPAGIDPLSRTLTSRRLGEMLDSRQNIKAWLLRQDKLVGLGNIYASEILHAAAIDPQRMADTLDGAEARALFRETRRILRRAIRACGTTFSDFQDARGVEGSYQAYLSVYGREGERCRRCRAPVVRIVQQQRSTYYCAGCQR